jgi:hypothetical protein
MKASAAASLVSLTVLRNLRSLELLCKFEPSGVLGKFTSLSSLSLRLYRNMRPGTVFPDLACLTGLGHLAVSDMFNNEAGAYVTGKDLAFLTPLSKLTSLRLDGCTLADCLRGSSALVPLKGIVSLAFCYGPFGVSLLPMVDVAALQSLSVSCVRGDISILHRATALTHLEFSSHNRQIGFPESLGPAIAKMSGLRALTLSLDRGVWVPGVFDLGPVLRSLKMLTHLKFRGSFTVGARGDLKAIASLPCLKSLWLTRTSAVTPTCLPTLQAMSGLTKLVLCQTGISLMDLTPEVIARFDVERLCRGWPRLKLGAVSSVQTVP